MDFRKVSDGDGMKEISYDELKEAARPLILYHSAGDEP